MFLWTSKAVRRHTLVDFLREGGFFLVDNDSSPASAGIGKSTYTEDYHAREARLWVLRYRRVEKEYAWGSLIIELICRPRVGAVRMELWPEALVGTSLYDSSINILAMSIVTDGIWEIRVS